jgi:hypothetical protein
VSTRRKSGLPKGVAPTAPAGPVITPPEGAVEVETMPASKSLVRVISMIQQQAQADIIAAVTENAEDSGISPKDWKFNAAQMFWYREKQPATPKA